MIKKKINTIKCGIIGLGRSGWNIHAKILKKNPNYSIEALCDTSKSRLIKCSAELKCKAYYNYKDIIDDKNVELIIVSTPSKTHYKIAKDALLSGKNVVIEKPITSKIFEIKDLKKTAFKTKKFIVPFFNFRFNREFKIIKEIFNKKLIGEVFLIKKNVCYYNRRDDWQSKIDQNGGIINAAAIHHIDQIFQLLNSKPKLLFKDIRKLVSKGNAPDHCKLIFKFASNCIVDIEVSWAAALDNYTWHILGTNGSIKQDKNILECKWFNEEDVKKEVKNERSYYSNEKIKWRTKKYTMKKNNSEAIVPEFYTKLSNTLNLKEDVPVKINSIIKLMENIERFKLN